MSEKRTKTQATKHLLITLIQKRTREYRYYDLALIHKFGGARALKSILIDLL